ncbi:tyrosyl-DNA phosphodiesterase-domain-containing protein [Phycomyces nitens]|nr:tyrosyl-DNA phosphodiesterase-domain-containing protein [Phycomyces nitens]
MSNDNDENELEYACALSEKSFLESVNEEERERKDMIEAIAASLGKTPDQLTAREMLTLTLNPPRKRTFLDNSAECSRKRPTNSPVRYWDGVVKLTHVPGFVGTQFIRFQDIVEKSTLKKALVTAFVCSMDWIEEQFPSTINMCIVLHGRPATRSQISPNRLLIHPPMLDNTYGVFHPKLMLLFREDSLRVVIGSANMERYDYEDIENVVFIQDFPKLSKKLNSVSDLPTFSKDLCHFLDRMSVPPSVKEAFLDYDFSKAKAHLVTSVSGTFEGNNYNKYGHTRLCNIIKEIGAADPDRLPRVEMQTSSLGSLNKSYLLELYRSFCGLDQFENGTRPNTKDKELPPISIVYPSRNTVDSSRLGPPGASTICLSTAAWNKPTFPKEIMCDAISYRDGTLMHSKYIIATLPHGKYGSTQKNRVDGWIYCGSHNATQSAWGKTSFNKTSNRPRIRISNWELGVVFPINESTDIVAPYIRPPPKYRTGQNAWTQEM